MKVKFPNKQKVKCSCNTSGCSRGQQTVYIKSTYDWKKKDEVAVFVNTLKECSLMSVHNWTSPPPNPPTHTETPVNISNTVIWTSYRASQKHLSTTRVCVRECVYVCPRRSDVWGWEGSRKALREGKRFGGGEGGRGERVTLHERNCLQVLVSAPLYRTIQECPVERNHN